MSKQFEFNDLVKRYGLEECPDDSPAKQSLRVAVDLVNAGPYDTNDEFDERISELITTALIDDRAADHGHVAMVVGSARAFALVLETELKAAAAVTLITEASLRDRLGIQDGEYASIRSTAVTLVAGAMNRMVPGVHYKNFVRIDDLSPKVQEIIKNDQDFMHSVFGMTSGMLDLLNTQDAA